MSQLFMLPQLVHDLGRSGKTWLEFLRVGVPCNVRELEQCARNVMIRGEYRPRRRNPAVHDLAGALEAGTLTAEALVRRYCTLCSRARAATSRRRGSWGWIGGR